MASPDLFSTLLAEACPIEIQRQALRRAERTKDTALFVQLANTPSLAQEIDDVLSHHKMAPARAAWLSHSDRDPTLIAEALASESRVTVLRPLAERIDLSDDAYEQLIAKNLHAVTWTLLHNPRITGVQASAMARTYDPPNTETQKRTWKACEEVQSLLQLRPYLASDLAFCSADWVACNTPGMVMTSAASLNVAKRLIGALEATLAKSAPLVTSTSRVPYQRSVAWRMAANKLMQLCRTSSLTATDASTVLKLWNKLVTDSKYLYPAEQTSNSAGSTVELLEKYIASSPTPATPPVCPAVTDIAALVQAIGRNPSQGGATQLMLHPGMTPELAQQVAKAVPWSTRKVVFSAWRSDLEMTATLMLAWGSYVDADFKRFQDPPALYTRMVELASASGNLRVAQTLASSSFLTKEHVPLFTPAALVRCCRNTRFSLFLKDFLVESLGEDDELWAMFESLNSDFAGTTGDLLDVVKLVSVRSD